MISGFYTLEPNPTLTTTPQQRCTVSMRERKKGNIETTVYRLKKEPAMALYSRPPEGRGMGPQATMFLKRVATLLAAKTSQDKSLIMANLRHRLRFELLKTVLIAVRGHRGRHYEKAIPVDELDLNLAHTTNDEDRGDDVDNEDDEVDDEVENVEEKVAEE